MNYNKKEFLRRCTLQCQVSCYLLDSQALWETGILLRILVMQEAKRLFRSAA